MAGNNYNTCVDTGSVSTTAVTVTARVTGRLPQRGRTLAVAIVVALVAICVTAITGCAAPTGSPTPQSPDAVDLRTPGQDLREERYRGIEQNLTQAGSGVPVTNAEFLGSHNGFWQRNS